MQRKDLCSLYGEISLVSFDIVCCYPLLTQKIKKKSKKQEDTHEESLKDCSSWC
jgi:hypothetical protein